MREYNQYGWTPPNAGSTVREFNHGDYRRNYIDDERERLANEGIWIGGDDFTSLGNDQTVLPTSSSAGSRTGLSTNQARELDALSAYSGIPAYEWTNEPPERQSMMDIRVGTSEGIPEGPALDNPPLRRRIPNSELIAFRDGGSRSSGLTFEQQKELEGLKNQNRAENSMALYNAKMNQAVNESNIRRAEKDFEMEASNPMNLNNPQAVEDARVRRDSTIGKYTPTTPDNYAQKYPAYAGEKPQVEVSQPQDRLIGRDRNTRNDIYEDSNGRRYSIINGTKKYISGAR